MQAVKSSIVIHLKKLVRLIPAVLLTGCSLPPAIPLLGAYYPSWLFCIIAGIILTSVTRALLLRKCKVLPFAGIVYTALFALYSMLFWLVFF